MKIRGFAAFVMVAVLLCAVCPLANAAPENGSIIAPFWTNVSDVSVSVTFSGTTATCTGIIKGFSGTTKITADFVLERKNSNGTYTVVKAFSTKTVESATLRFSDTATITTGNTYRLSVSATVTRNGTKEVVSGWVEAKG